MTVRLGDILFQQPKSKIKAGEGLEKGAYRFFTSSNIQTKYIDSYQYDGPALIFGTGGSASVHFCDEKFATSTDCLVFYANEEYILRTIYFYLLGNIEILEKGFKGAGLKHISKKYILDIDFLVPPLEEQQKITETLDKVSDLIVKRKQQLEKLDLLVKSKFVEMFGDPFVNPKSWNIVIFSDIIQNANNGMARRGNDLDGDIVLRLVELQNGYIDYSSPNRIILNEAEKKRYRLLDKDFLFARVNGNPDNVGRCAVFNDIKDPVYHNDHIIRVHFNDELVNGTFLSVLLNSEYGKSEMRNKIKTSAGQYTISQDGIGAVKSILPPIKLQTQFAEFVQQTEHTKSIIKQSLEKLETLKKALMQEYFG